MRRYRIMLIVAIAMLVGVAVVGAGSASATALCKTNSAQCGAIYPAGTELQAAGPISFTSGSFLDRCENSEVKVKTLSNGGASAEVGLELAALNFGGCINGPITTKSRGSGNLSYTGGGNGNISGSGTEVEIRAGGGTTCFYGGTVAGGLVLEGGTEMRLEGTNVLLTRLTGSSPLCPNPVKVNLNMTAVGPITTGYVAEAPVPGSILCQSSTVPCPSSYPTGTPLSAKLSSSQATLAAGFSTIKCNESLASMQVTAAGGVFEAATTKLTSLAFGSCNAAVSVLSSGSASVRTIPGTADGNLIESGTEIEVQIGTTKCFYGGEVSSGLVLEAGAPATLTATNAPLTRQPGSSLLCAPQAKFGAKYTFTGLNTSLYVADH